MKKMITIEAEGSNEAVKKIEKMFCDLAAELDGELDGYVLTKENAQIKGDIKIPDFIMNKNGSKKEAV